MDSPEVYVPPRQFYSTLTNTICCAHTFLNNVEFRISNLNIMIEGQIIFFSLIAITMGTILWRRGSKLLQNWKTTHGKVIGNNPKNSDGGIVYYPVIEFLTDQNETILKELNVGTNPSPRIGRIIKVLYDPQNPTDIVSRPVLNLEIIPRILVAIGITGIIVAVLSMLGLINLPQIVLQ